MNGAYRTAAILCLIPTVLISCGPKQEAHAPASTEVRPSEVRATPPEASWSPVALSMIAESDANMKRSLWAISMLSDQASLAEVAARAYYEEARDSAYSKITDQSLVVKIVLDHEDDVLGHNTSYEAIYALKDQSLLAKVAAESKSPDCRGLAVSRISDQGLLAKLAVESSFYDVRKTAVEKLTDQVLLQKIAATDSAGVVREAALTTLVDPDRALVARMAVQDKEDFVRTAAVSRLKDQSLLSRIALHDGDPSARRAAAKRLDDQVSLARLAVKDPEESVRQAAVERLTNQAVLYRIALHDSDEGIRMAAVERMTDQALLVSIVRVSKQLDIRQAAIGRLTDQVLLREWATKNPQAAVRQGAVRQIADDSFLVRRIPVESSEAVRGAIIETLHGKSSLREVALTAYHHEDREQALDQLRKHFPDEASDIAQAHQALAESASALSRESDESKLLAISLEGRFDNLRTAAVIAMKDTSIMEEAATRSHDRETLRLLLAKLENRDALNRIAAAADDRAMRLAAAQKSGIKSWKKIFAAATDGGATSRQLGDAVAAVSLLYDVQPDAIEAVQQACLSLIRRGDESRIPELADLLEGYGDKTLAEDYLNCGQPDLYASGESWANRRGYSVGYGSGSSRAIWGNGR
jgi:uncharacterized protein YihD (DUF1040 family)